MHTRKFVQCISLFTFISLTAFATGTEALAEDIDPATEAFKLGVETYNKGDFIDSANSFRRAYELKNAWKLLHNIGQAEMSGKRYGLALEAFERYLVKGGDNLSKKRQKYVLDQIDNLRKLVGNLEILVPNGSVVVIDGVERSRTMATVLSLAVGVEHRVVVKCGEETLLDQLASVNSKHTITIEVENLSEPDKELAVPPVQKTAVENSDLVAIHSKDESRLSPVFWGFASTTIVAGAISGMLWGMTAIRANDLQNYKKQYDSLDSSRPDFSAENDRLFSRINDTRSNAIKLNYTAIASTAFTGALLGAAIAVFLVNLLGEENQKSDNSFLLGPGPGGVVVRF